MWLTKRWIVTVQFEGGHGSQGEFCHETQLNSIIQPVVQLYSELTDPGQSQVRYRNAIRNTMRNQ